MTVLVDTGVLYAEHDTDATRHETAADALETVYDGELGHPYISDYVFDEAITLARRRTGSFSSAKRLSDRLRGRDVYPRVFEMQYVTAAVFADAVNVFEQYDDQQLSFTDATIVALVERYDIDRVLSFDGDFDGIVDRIDPADL
ncbi:type II toxin-antitoxin system VapC family toxin [Halobellus salinisoli]|uniref:type II toxin-antitoxin system VapC family toxin n=1 Tax=Halobellus salinisoli TaxID=3108500 RepID=UPI0030089E7D